MTEADKAATAGQDTATSATLTVAGVTNNTAGAAALTGGATLLDSQEPNWLPSRLARKEKEIAKSLGFESLDEIKVSLAKAKELEQEKLSEAERMRARIAELEPLAKERNELATAINVQAEAAMASLTQEQRDAVAEIADTPAKQLRAIERLRPTWAKPVAAQAPIAAPSSTTPAPSAPPATSVTSGPNHLAVWEGLKKSNPYAAAQYLNKYGNEILTQKSARG